jgi:hypothetical protein
LLIWPLPLASSCENRFCSAADWLVDDEADVDDALAVAVDDWLCAANSALSVPGASGENPLEPEAEAELAEDAALPERLKGSVAPSLNPVACAADDGFDEVSDLMASHADDAAPKANSMMITPKLAARGRLVRIPSISKPRASKKSPMK